MWQHVILLKRRKMNVFSCLRNAWRKIVYVCMQVANKFPATLRWQVNKKTNFLSFCSFAVDLRLQKWALPTINIYFIFMLQIARMRKAWGAYVVAETN